MDNKHSETNSALKSEIEIETAEVRLRSLATRRWLRTSDVAIYLGTTRSAIKKLVLRRRLEPKKLYGRLYFDRLELDRLIENSPRGASKTQLRRNRWR